MSIRVEHISRKYTALDTEKKTFVGQSISNMADKKDLLAENKGLKERLQISETQWAEARTRLDRYRMMLQHISDDVVHELWIKGQDWKFAASLGDYLIQ